MVAFAWIKKMKKLSHKDLIIALGVAVAAIIIISIYIKDSTSQSERSLTKPGQAKPTVFVKKVLEKLVPKAHI